MKTILKIVFLTSFFLLISVFPFKINALETNKLELYPINIDKINDILSFYKKKTFSIFKIVENVNRINLKNNEEEQIVETKEENIKEVENNIPEIPQESANFDSKYTDLATYALQFVGNPYVYGGTSLTEGTDCSGFVMRLYEHFGVKLPRTSKAQATVGYSVSIQNAQPGDIVSYGYNGIVSHSAIYIGDEMVVHASTPQGGIRVDNMYMMPIITIRRIG